MIKNLFAGRLKGKKPRAARGRPRQGRADRMKKDLMEIREDQHESDSTVEVISESLSLYKKNTNPKSNFCLKPSQVSV